MTQIVWSDPQFNPIVQQVCTRTGLFFRDSQRETVELGIRRAMQQEKHTGLAEYGEYIQRHPRAFDQLMIELTVGETYFFREIGQLEFIRREILPEIRTRRGLSHSIRVWSAGCATGEEAYSLAMMFTEEGLADRTHILATDISRRSLESAQKAEYRKWSLRGEGAHLAARYLREDGDCYHVVPAIRSRVRFEYLNLALDVYPSNITGTLDLDLILCRNVLIYFDRGTIASVAKRFYDALTPGGWAVTASGDPSLEDHAPFETIMTKFGLFYRRNPAVESSTAATLSIPSTPALPASGTSPPLANTWPQILPRNEAEPVKAAVTPRITSFVIPPITNTSVPAVETLKAAQHALDVGDYKLAAEIAARLPDTVDSVAVRVQALANTDLRQAEQVCADGAMRHKLSARLQYLHAVLLLDLNREQEAAQAARRAVYLDNSLAIAHFTLGSIMRRLGDVEGARRSFRNARDLCATRPSEEVVCFADGERAGALAQAAQLQLEGLDR